MLEDFRLRVFVKVAECGNFTLAARDLGITQPAVSQNIAALEQAMGEALFNRARGQASLTPKGEAFLAYAGKILYWYDRIDAELVRAEQPTPAKTLLPVSELTDAEISVEDGTICIKLKDKQAGVRQL